MNVYAPLNRRCQHLIEPAGFIRRPKFCGKIEGTVFVMWQVADSRLMGGGWFCAEHLQKFNGVYQCEIVG